MKYVVVDIDGTISLVGSREKYWKKGDYKRFNQLCHKDKPNRPVIELVQLLAENHKIIFCTGRMTYPGVAKKTIAWIKIHLGMDVVPGYNLLMREEYDGDFDTVLKPAMLKTRNITPENTFCILEDRTDMVYVYRKLGFLCLQVDDHGIGNVS
jgi:desulfoferrodoxin (superoxide reductase-like protein)